MAKCKEFILKYHTIIGLLACACAVVGFGLSLAAARTITCDYVSINGDFQSYNVFRRILDGQFAYADFANYIGMAPVWMNLPLLLFRSDFWASLFVTNFTAHALFALAVGILAYCITQHATFSLLFAALFAKIISTQILGAVLGQGIGDFLLVNYQGLYTPSNSMRIARSFLPFFLVLLYALVRLLAKDRIPKGIDLFRTVTSSAVVGGVLGLLFLWSNDYGMACAAAATVILLLYHAFVYRAGWAQFGKCLGAFLLCFALGLLLCATLVTGGQPMAYFASISGTGEAQFYYFNGVGGTPVLVYLVTNTRFLAWAGLCCLLLVYFTITLVRGKLTDTSLALYFMMASVLAGTMAYILAGSGYNAREPLEGYTLICLLALLAKGALWLLRRFACQITFACTALLCLAGLWLGGAGAVAALTMGDAPDNTVYVEALGGYTSTPNALLAADEITGDADVQIFSVYATGLEVVKGQFQPTGYDYIIHALGSDAQADYLETFLAGEYTFVQTSSLPVEGWVTLQNWYFYRELYSVYTKVYQTEYSWLWQRSESQAIEAEISYEIITQADGSVMLSCTSDTTEPFIADFAISYAAEYQSTWDALCNLGRSSVFVYTGSIFPDDSSYNGFAMAGQGSDVCVPVVMQDGEGYILLSSVGMGDATVTITEAAYLGGLPQHTLSEYDAE